ncbi:MAG: hypothetical protein LBF84_01730 [Holosporales bacterium]|nr:hypothetical protein [Holosporales bacterium]
MRVPLVSPGLSAAQSLVKLGFLPGEPIGSPTEGVSTSLYSVFILLVSRFFCHVFYILYARGVVLRAYLNTLQESDC